VHPNFFSWASVRALFWRTAQVTEDSSAAGEISILLTNFRNTQAVTGLANRLLRIKQARFGSVDRESNWTPPNTGFVRLRGTTVLRQAVGL
jgi:hypothetical protein